MRGSLNERGDAMDFRAHSVDVSSGAAVSILTMEFIKNKVLPAASTGAGLGFESRSQPDAHY
jgi:hypothetical protein